jgi:hypothetical protein
MMDWLAHGLTLFFEPIHSVMRSIPLSRARLFVLALLILPLVGLLLQKRSFIFRGAPDQKRWRDLRLWAVIVLLPYVVLYALSP